MLKTKAEKANQELEENLRSINDSPKIVEELKLKQQEIEVCVYIVFGCFFSNTIPQRISCGRHTSAVGVVTSVKIHCHATYSFQTDQVSCWQN